VSARGSEARALRPDTEAGLDNGRARRRHWGWSATKHDNDRGGGGGSGAVGAWVHFLLFSCKKEGMVNY
jgi:hypothetical protein